MLGSVHELVNFSRLEAAVETDVGRIGESPRRPGDCPRRGARMLADGQARGRIAEVGGRMGDVVAVGHRQRLDTGVRPPLAADRSADRPVSAAHRRDRQGHEPVASRDVVLPTAPCDRVAPAHEKTVAEVLRSRRVGHSRRAVEQSKRDLAAAVRNVEEEPAVAARRVLGPQQIKIGFALDQSRGGPRRRGEVGDGLVCRVHRIDADAEHAHDLLVRAGRPERTTVQHHRTPRDLE